MMTKFDSLNLTAPHTMRELGQADCEALGDMGNPISDDLNLAGWIERRKRDVGPYADHIIKAVTAYEVELRNLRERPAAQKLGEWDALKEFKERAEFARKAYKHVCGDIAGRVPTVGKHQAVNHEHLRRIYVEAKDAFPQFADTLAWMLWHEIVSFDRLVILVEDFTISAPAQIGGAA